MGRIASKKFFEEVSLYDMRWEKQAMEDAIKDKKDEQEKLLVDQYTKYFMEELNGTTEKDVQRLMRDFVRSIVQVEREI